MKSLADWSASVAEMNVELNEWAQGNSETQKNFWHFLFLGFFGLTAVVCWFLGWGVASIVFGIIFFIKLVAFVYVKAKKWILKYLLKRMLKR